MENKKKSNVGKWLPWVICAISLILLISPFDILNDSLSLAMLSGEPIPIGHLDEPVYLLSGIVSFISGFVNLFKKR